MNGKKVRIGACLLIGDIDRMVRFYRDILGFSTEWNRGNFVEYYGFFNMMTFTHDCRYLYVPMKKT